MVAKPSRKKQALASFERDDGHISVSIEALFPGVGEQVLAQLGELIRWLGDLAAARSSAEQVRVIHQNKKKARVFLLDADLPADALAAGLAGLLRLYLLPTYFAFHVALDWITMLLKDFLTTNSTLIKATVTSVCLEVNEQCQSALTPAAADLTVMVSWQSAISSIVLLERDLDFLDPSTLLDMLWFLVNQLTALQALPTDPASMTAPELVKWTTCCIDTSRNIGNLLKGHLSQSREGAWTAVCSAARKASYFTLMTSDSKDPISAAAAVFILASYALDDRPLDALQDMLWAIVSNHTDPDTQIPRFPKIKKLSPLSQCALVREGNTLFSHQWTLPGLLVGSCRYALSVCEDSSSALQLYAMQTIEAWLGQLPNAAQDGEVSACLMAVLRLLCRTWTHPARQVNHIVPDIFDRLLSACMLMPNIHWPMVLSVVLGMPAGHRGRYQALRALLALGVLDIHTQGQGLFADLLWAIGHREVAASASALLVALLTDAKEVEEVRAAILAALCSEDSTLRSNIADYLLPHLLKIKAFSASILLQQLAGAPATAAVLAGQVAIILAAQNPKSPDAQIAKSPDTQILTQVQIDAQAVQAEQITQICLLAANSEDDCLRGNALLALTTFPRNSNIPRSNNTSQLVLDKLTYSLKTSEPDMLKKISRAISALLLRGKDDSSLIPRILSLVQANYPGSTFAREISSLNLLEAILPSVDSASSSAVVIPLLRAFISAWDRTRIIASSLLQALPVPWSGFTDPSSLLHWALTMTESARLRESDAGASLVANIFQAYRLQGFVRMLLERLESNLQVMEVDQLSPTIPLGHGLLLAIKLCLLVQTQIPRSSPKSQDPSMVPSREIYQLTYKTALRSLQLAMKVVGEASSDVPFAPTGAKGPVMAASYVNTNTYTSLDGGQSASQRGIVAAWLLVKEAASVLATLVTLAPVPSAAGASASDLLTAQEVESIGTALLDALGRLKHMGAIAEAHIALQEVANCLIRYGDANTSLAKLPSVWLDELIGRLYNHQQVFILRRSAGFAYSFLALLRAEPANGPATMLHHTMQKLLALVKLALDDEHAVTQSDAPNGNEWWKLAVHALNVVRIIILDSSFGPELDHYITTTLSYAVRGFLSSHWAIRNSSMMVYAVTIQRTISREKNDTSASVTAFDYFNRYDLLPFLIQQLADGHQDVLYPLLMLFAKFRAPLLVDGSNFTDLLVSIEKCTAHPMYAIRSITARAYTALIAVQDVGKHVKGVFAAIQCLSLQDTAVAANTLHGKLLLAFELIKQIAKQEQGTLFQAFCNELQALEGDLQAVVIFVDQRQAPPLHHVLLQLLQVYHQLVPCKDVLLSTAARCMDYLQVHTAAGMTAPYAPLLARLSVEIILSAEVNPQLLSLWESPVSEVRDGVSAGLHTLLGDKEVLASMKLDEVICSLAKCMDNETEPASMDLHVELMHR